MDRQKRPNPSCGTEAGGGAADPPDVPVHLLLGNMTAAGLLVTLPEGTDSPDPTATSGLLPVSRS